MVTGNATAELLGTVLLPLADWLCLEHVVEQPAPRIHWVAQNHLLPLQIHAHVYTDTVCKERSLLFQWPSIQKHKEVLEESGVTVWVIKLNLLHFGCFASKKLMMQGTWRALPLLAHMDSFGTVAPGDALKLSSADSKGRRPGVLPLHSFLLASRSICLNFPRLQDWK